MYRKTLLSIFCILTALSLGAQGRLARDFQPAADSLRERLQRRTTVATDLKLTKVMQRGTTFDFYFTQDLVDYPWRNDDVDWFRDELRSLFPTAYRSYALGEIYGKKTALGSLPMPALHKDGKPAPTSLRVSDPRGSVIPLVRGDDNWPRGLSARHIALWQSHGRYYEAKTGRWEWQRAATHRTVEDLFTQSFVLPFLIPMLENAGACVMTPRERDTQVHEVVCDNDPAFRERRTPSMRREGRYKETGNWTDAGVGFADAKAVYSGYDNPFTLGTARMAETAGSDDAHRKAEATWRPDIPERGRYAVYVSYKSLANSTTDARYTVHHLGGDTQLHVNQRMGGGTWVYLGTFLFDEGDDGYVRLTNRSAAGGVVTADAVRFGGGMGKVERGGMLSGYPAYTEGALYGMQWSGIDLSLFDDWDNDYTKDFAGRGRWVTHLSGGSRVNPDAEGRQIPFDLSLAFHSDAGLTPNDSIVGTLAIYTLLCEGSDRLPDGESRLNGRALADAVQTQVVDDIRAQFEPAWSRRQTWDRSYSESRTTSVPGLLLEVLSHQNFADMKYGLDPAFRFTVSRAVYKGILKYLSNRYGCTYVVQPLPVTSFAAELRDGKALLSWKPAEDPLEPTAVPDGYILQTRIGDGGFDDGVRIQPASSGERLSVTVPVRKGQVVSFRIVAFNDGGKSFPSETLSVGHPGGGARPVLIVNNFDRISAPAWFDTPSYGGFMDNIDSGVPYIEDINFIGPVYQFDRTRIWTDDDNPGFGGSYVDQAGRKVAGNTFDFPSVHGKALLEAGYAFSSMSRDAFCALDAAGYTAVDLVCGKQVTTKMGSGALPDRYQVFPEPLQEALRRYTSAGGNVLLSGAYIGTDAWDRVYPVSPDPATLEQTRTFIQEVLGYKWVTNFGDVSGVVEPYGGFLPGSIAYNRKYSPVLYRVENPDGIEPASPKARTILRYAGTAIPAGTAYDSGTHRVVALGFPIESILAPDSRKDLMQAAMDTLLE
ncbi:MAG: N-acetylmuramoyl-L-alanine amidase [Bacteroidales bacterium]|nr:N-acetylmuramoyl-L-alanine amidase [Bacteroidales bacterium]